MTNQAHVSRFGIMFSIIQTILSLLSHPANCAPADTNYVTATREPRNLGGDLISGIGTEAPSLVEKIGSAVVSSSTNHSDILKVFSRRSPSASAASYLTPEPAFGAVVPYAGDKSAKRADEGSGNTSSIRRNDGDDEEDEEDEEQHPEPFTEQSYTASIVKGTRNRGWMDIATVEELTDAMREAKVIAADASSQSRFLNYPQDLADNGWVKNWNFDSRLWDFGQDVRLETAFRSLDLSTDFPQTLTSVSWHQFDSHFNGKFHELATMGSYSNFFNPTDGVILVQSLGSPSYMLRINLHYEGYSHKEIDGMLQEQQYAVPELHSVSDVQFLEYAHLAQERRQNPAKLKYIFQHDVHTQSTIQLIDHILKKQEFPDRTGESAYGNYHAPAWHEKLTFVPDDDEFAALLASAQGNSVMFLLIQHREAFGHKRVKSIDVFQDDPSPEKTQYNGATLLFELEDLDKDGKVIVGAEGQGAGSEYKAGIPGSEREIKRIS